MPIYRLGPGDDRFRSSETADWSDGSSVHGRAGDDDIAVTASRDITLTGGSGDDLLSLMEVIGARVCGGAGADHLVLDRVNEAVARGGGGADTIEAYGFFLDIEGGAGADRITAYGAINTVRGGAGDDTLELGGQRITETVGEGGAGDDILRGSGYRDNALLGGAGNDRFETVSFGISMYGEGDVGWRLTGGPGRDSFAVSNRASAVVRDEDTDGVLGQGETVLSIMDVVTDFRRGESVDFGATVRNDHVTLVDTVPPGDRLVQVADGQYAALRGTYLGDGESEGRFRVESDGHDTLVLYDRLDGSDNTGTGSLVLLGVSEPDFLGLA